MPAAARLVVALGLALTPHAASAEIWRAVVSDDGLRSANVDGSARWREVELAATLALSCRPGAGGSLVWRLGLEQPERLGAFDIDAFEGPDAPASGRRLSELSLEGGLLAARVVLAQTGAYEGGRFLLSAAAPATAASDAALFADAIGPGTRAVQWRLAAVTTPNEPLVARFPADGAATAVAETMLGCGPPPAPSAREIAAWRGRNPSVTGMLDSRLVRWHLAALSDGREADARARLARAEPVGVDGEVLYLLARGPETDQAAALLLGNRGGAMLILIDAGVVTRRVDPGRMLDPPPAVRRFVEATRVDAR